MKEYHKLVRDRIPGIIKEGGGVPSIRIASEAEYCAKLYEKLLEEAAELSEAPSLEEVADLYEVLGAICRSEGWSQKEIRQARRDKLEQRGGFEGRIILETVS